MMIEEWALLPQEMLHQHVLSMRRRWKEEDFRAVKIEAELILEANRLQLMKQDFEKAENAYLRSFTSKKSKSFPGATDAAHGDPSGKKDYQKKDGKEEDFDRVKDSLASRLVSKTSTETPSTSEKPDVSSKNPRLIPCTEVKWIRNIEKIIPNSRNLIEQQEALMVEVIIPNFYKRAIRSREHGKKDILKNEHVEMLILK
ncbi:uncharacterized protein TNCV_2735741 [Trichonephila clavipes]|nr:uncharacterized protein TNCV_2735741 [Trichonephila clavipes]